MPKLSGRPNWPFDDLVNQQAGGDFTNRTILALSTVNQSGDTPKRTGTESVFRRPCGVHRQSTDQPAHVQEATNGMEPSRSPGLASRENRDYQRATGPVYRASSFSTGGISPPDSQVFAGLDLNAKSATSLQNIFAFNSGVRGESLRTAPRFNCK